MAEQEVAKHTKNLLGAATSAHGFAHKLREIVLEMVIIVFAVSISIWFHSLGEHRHEQAQVRTFLLGLKKDLQSDMDQLAEVVAFHHKADQRYAALAALDPAQPPAGAEAAKFEQDYQFVRMNNFLVARLGRYEGFKSAGKLTNIENDQLLDQIIALYEYDVPKLNLSSGGWLSDHRKLGEFLDQATAEDDSTAGRYRALTSKKGKILLRKMVTYPQLYERAAKLQLEAKAIVVAIDKAYPEPVAVPR
ncbi:MAG: hypothetical protein JWP59_2468 [Massilia sp.]|nr:hypothetical protein [Massilia sp.]